MKILDILNIISFILQVQNNEELQKQTSNDEVIKKLHHDIMNGMDENRDMCNRIIEQNDMIIAMMRGDTDTQSQKDE